MDKQESILAEEVKIQSKTAPVVDAEPAPVEDAEPAAVVDDNEDHEDSALSDGDDATAHPRKNKGVGKRINELTREKHEERRAREQAQAEAIYWQQQAQRQAPEPARVEHQGKPTLEAYNYDQEAYFEALADFKADQKMQGFRAEQQQVELGRAQQAKAAKFREKIADFEKEVPGGWAEAVSAPFDPSPVMLEVISDSDIGPKIGHYLATHLDEAYSLSQLSPYGQAAALGRLEADLKRPAASSVRPATPVSRAPAPAPMLQGGSSATSPGKMGIEDHIAAVKAQRKAKFA